MTTQIQNGDEVRFSFLHWDRSKTNTGKGIVQDWGIVGTDRSWKIKVTDSKDYAPGEWIEVRQRHVYKV